MKFLVLFVGGALFFGGPLVGTYFMNSMRAAVHEKQPLDQRWSAWFRYPGKSLLVMNQYRYFFPDGRLRTGIWWSAVSSVIGFLILCSQLFIAPQH